MRKAYSGRAAAYEKKGDFDKALADHKMNVLYYALETEILIGLDAPERGKFLTETAAAYRARGNCLEALTRPNEATLDRKRADGLEADARKLENKASQDKDNPTMLHVQNGWPQPVTLVIAGVTHRLAIGAQKAIPVSSTSVPYEMQAGPHRSTGTLEAGKTYTIRPTP